MPSETQVDVSLVVDLDRRMIRPRAQVHHNERFRDWRGTSSPVTETGKNTDVGWGHLIGFLVGCSLALSDMIM
jgi:hypothetical protein